jgi:hypothetical protein
MAQLWNVPGVRIEAHNSVWLGPRFDIPERALGGDDPVRLRFRAARRGEFFDLVACRIEVAEHVNHCHERDRPAAVWTGGLPNLATTVGCAVVMGVNVRGCHHE